MYVCMYVHMLLQNLNEMGFCRVIRRSIGTSCNWTFQLRRPSSTVEPLCSNESMTKILDFIACTCMVSLHVNLYIHCVRISKYCNLKYGKALVTNVRASSVFIRINNYMKGYLYISIYGYLSI